MTASELFKQVLDAAIREVEAAGTPVFTFAFYHDHESRAVVPSRVALGSSSRALVGESETGTR